MRGLKREPFRIERYGRLQTVASAPPNKFGQAQVVCDCDCGNRVTVDRSRMRRGRCSSCGCLRREAGHQRVMTVLKPKHGLHSTVEYRAWSAMKGRCTNPNHKSWKDYGGRGIAVCTRWMSSVVAFFEDMGPRPSPNHSLERVDNTKGYEPGNCVWATMSTQSKNRRNTIRITAFGETLLLAEWSERTGIPTTVLDSRLRVGRWSAERTVSTPYRQNPIPWFTGTFIPRV